ncbi:MAG TPA: glycoside hydrolase family 88 protein [Kiritimatiellia bacterium]|nr:glycoside hydrolase family 88 protein [Kiritimatiellia bacterium]
MSEPPFLAQARFAGANRPVVYTDRGDCLMKTVADWQLAHPGPRHPAKWTNATWYRGLIELAKLDSTGGYWEKLRAIGEGLDWKPQDNIFHADDLGIGYAFLECHRKFGDPRMLQGIKDRLDYIIANRATAPLDEGPQEENKRWWWADALYMAPPTLVILHRITGDAKYIEFMDEEWWTTTEHLYDKEDHLFFRDARFLNSIREADGRKMFWSRGNGWVIGALTHVLSEMPADFPNRPRYVQLFREMTARLVALQPADGVWRASLLNPEGFPVPEASGSVFHTFALAWGLNNGLLDPAVFAEPLRKAWNGIVGLVRPDGMLGNVQQIGGRPQPTQPDQTQEYAVGGLLLAAAEIHRLAGQIA